MEVLDFLKVGLQAFGIGLTLVLFFKREINSVKEELKKTMEKNSEELRKLEKEFWDYREKMAQELGDKYVKKSDLDRLTLSIEEVKALLLKGVKNGKTA